MKLLIDTHLLLWAAGFMRRLPPAAEYLLSDPENELFFSVASTWEVVIKRMRGNLDFQVDALALRDNLLQNGYQELPITGPHALALGNLPPIHRDPFDRLLIAQATVEQMLLLTSDAVVARYPGPIRLL